MIHLHTIQAFADELGLIKEAQKPAQAKKLVEFMRKKPGVGKWVREQVSKGGIAPFKGAKRIPV